MPIFWILVVAAAILLWFLLSFLYKPLGRLAKRLWGDAQEAMSEDDIKDNKERKEQ